jgi:hypothetical protein
MQHTPPTREAALKRLTDFLPRIAEYPRDRSFVRPQLKEVSLLSPYIRFRLISEREVLLAALERYPFEICEKFVQEVVWRTYWKGWLERNPEVWSRYLKALEFYNGEGVGGEFLGELYERAVRGETRLSFFNEWVSQLISSGYLHNHIRMWFASVWIFTFRLPWELGASFMYRHLLDGDPASNTLSWRWVAGLQTVGKSYLVSASNIERFSCGLWRPKEGDLATEVFKVTGADNPKDATAGLGVSYPELPQGRYSVLTTYEDLNIDSQDELVRGGGGVWLMRFGVVNGGISERSAAVNSFISGAERDLISRLGGSFIGEVSRDYSVGWCGLDTLCDSVLREGGMTLVAVEPAIGEGRGDFDALVRELSCRGVKVLRYRCSWDLELYKLASRGFFPYWEGVRKRLLAGERF